MPDNHPALKAADDIAGQGGKEQLHAQNLSSIFMLFCIRHSSLIIAPWKTSNNSQIQ
jgi:hypothetical protein